jgi:hypothetical protein
LLFVCWIMQNWNWIGTIWVKNEILWKKWILTSQIKVRVKCIEIGWVLVNWNRIIECWWKKRCWKDHERICLWSFKDIFWYFFNTIEKNEFFLSFKFNFIIRKIDIFVIQKFEPRKFNEISNDQFSRKTGRISL